MKGGIIYLSSRASINELRRELGIKPEDLVGEIEIYNVERLELKEKERLK